MSVTTTSNPVTTQTIRLLTDYEIHHSGDPDATAPSPNAHPIPPTPSASTTLSSSSAAEEQPDNWPTEHRRIPPHRPINRELDFAERPAGLNGAEFVFIQVMLNGVRLNANVARLWRATGGKINDRIFRYDVGGEW